MKKIAITLCVSALFFIGCSGEYVRENFFPVAGGMNGKQVVSMVGDPEYKYVSGSKEVWEYKRYDVPGFCYRIFFVWFADGVVTGVTTFKPVTCSYRSGIIAVPGMK